MIESVNTEKTSNEADSKIDRNMILSWLKDDITYLRNKARCDNPGHSMMKVQLLRASIYGCSVALAALKDTEIEEIKKDIELIKEKLGMKT